MKLKNLLLFFTVTKIKAITAKPTTKLFIKGKVLHIPYLKKNTNKPTFEMLSSIKPSASLIPFVGLGTKIESEESFLFNDFLIGPDFNLTATLLGIGYNLNDEHSISFGFGIKAITFSSYIENKEYSKEFFGRSLSLQYIYNPKKFKNIEISLAGEINKFCLVQTNSFISINFSLGISRVF